MGAFFPNAVGVEVWIKAWNEGPHSKIHTLWFILLMRNLCSPICGSTSKTCMECMRLFAEMSPDMEQSGNTKRCLKCRSSHKRSNSTAGQILSDNRDDYNVWMEQNTSKKLPWPKVRVIIGRDMHGFNGLCVSYTTEWRRK